jgi:hypothetical protein
MEMKEEQEGKVEKEDGHLTPEENLERGSNN